MTSSRPESSESLTSTTYEEALEHVKNLEEPEILDSTMFYEETEDLDVFTYQIGDDLASVRRKEEGILLEGSKSAKEVLKHLQSSQGG